MADFDFSKFEQYKIDIKDYTPVPKLQLKNHPTFSAVKVFKHKITHEKVVQKGTPKPLTDDDIAKSFYRELSILSQCQHPAIVPFIGYARKTNGFLYLKYFENGSIYIVIEKERSGETKNLDITQKLIITYGIAAAMEYLHANQIIHRDLKPENVLLDSDFFPVITDFGTSKFLDEPSTNNTIWRTTPYIMAPEYISDPHQYKSSPRIDVFSYAMTLYYLWVSEIPYKALKTEDAIFDAIVTGVKPSLPAYVPPQIRYIISCCWSQSPELRPTFSEILEELKSPIIIDLMNIDQQRYIAYMNKIDMYRPTLKLNPSNSGFHIPEQDTFFERIEENGSEILADLRQQAESDPNDKLQLAIALYKGKYGEKDIQSSIQLLNEISSTSNGQLKSDSYYYLGRIYFDQKDFQQSENYLRESKSNKACFFLAEQMSHGPFQPKYLNEPEVLYRTAADQGYLKAIRKYALLKYHGSSHICPERNIALQYIHKGFLRHDPEMTFMHSQMIEMGLVPKATIDQAMDCLELAVKKNYAPAQLSYGLHLFSGRKIEQKLADAAYFFELAAINGNATAQFYTALQYMKDSPDEFLSYLKSSVEQSEDDACAFQGKLFFQNGDLQNALKLIQPSCEHGSILGLLTMANICEQYPEHGDSSHYYQVASQRCHSLDSLAFQTPIPYKHYYCDKCKQHMCEGCAKHCHAGHPIRLLGEESRFSCECGSNISDHCNAEYFGKKCYSQHLYQCLTCAPSNTNEYLCSACLACHPNHKIIDCGIVQNKHSFCHCGTQKLKSKCSLLSIEFSSDYSDSE